MLEPPYARGGLPLPHVPSSLLPRVRLGACFQVIVRHLYQGFRIEPGSGSYSPKSTAVVACHGASQRASGLGDILFLGTKHHGIRHSGRSFRMARPVVAAGGIEIVEEAIHVLRGAGVRALALLWSGAIPFALGILLFWRDMTHYNRSSELCGRDSFLLVALLLWMNVWRGIFAAKVHTQLVGVPVGRRDGFLRMLGVHLLLGNCKLVLIPLAAMTVLPLPGAVAFFRTATTVAAVDRDDFSNTVAKSRKLAASISQPVLLILLLAFIATLLFVNITVLLALLPQLVRILTGYESSFTRAGFRILADPSFYIVASLTTWLAFEPLVQTVYTVAAFHAESKRTGEDLRALFRALLRSGGIAALILVLCAPVMKARPALDASQLDRSVRQTLASPQYGWNVQRRETPLKEPWLVRFTDSIGARLSGVKAAIGRGIDRLTDWFRKMFETQAAPDHGGPASSAIRSELYVALLAALLVAGFLIWRGRAALARKRIAISAVPGTISLAAHNITADQLPEQGWYLLAEECFSNGELRLGLRALYLANLAGLAHEGWIAIHPGKTDHEYESELHRRGRAFPDACELFSVNVEQFERVWYGDYPVSLDDCQVFRERAEKMQSKMAPTGVTA